VKRSRALQFQLEYIALLVMAAVVRHLPRTFVLWGGQCLGRLAGWVQPARHRLARHNMQRAFPEMSSAEVARNVSRVFAHFGASSVDMLRLDRFRPGSDDLQRYFDLSGIDHIRRAYGYDRGVLFLTGHLGVWEAGNFAMPELGFPFDVVAKPMKNPRVDTYVTRLRESHGARVLDSKKGARRILKSLQQGRGVAILLDQHIRPPGSVAVDFFGRKAYTTTAITNMAMKFQIPVVPIFITRLPDFRYRLSAEAPMFLENGADSDLIHRNTQLLTDRIEAAARRDVTQWFWMHKRWRVPEEKAPDDTISA